MKAKIEKWYKQGLWTKKMVANAVVKKQITADDYYDITGDIYTEGFV